MSQNQRGFNLAGGLVILMALGLIMGVSIVMVLADKDDNKNGTTKKKTLQIESTPAPKKELIRTCPEQWYKDEMPTSEPRPEENREYFIIGSKRVEKKDVDVEWVEANCSVNEPQIIN